MRGKVITNRSMSQPVKPNKTNFTLSGKSKPRHKLKESDVPRRREKGVFIKSSGEVKVCSDASKADLSRDNTSSELSRCEGTNSNLPSPASASLPRMDMLQTEGVNSELRKIARTFTDSVISLLSRSLASSGCMQEGMFLELIKCQGFIEAICIAKGLTLPHDRSATMLSMLLLGPNRNYKSLLSQAVPRDYSPHH